MSAVARQDLVLEDLGDEVIAYDPATAVAHVLSPLATSVLLLCDGEHDEDAIASALATDGRVIDPALVRAAVVSLSDIGLLVPQPA